MAASPFVNGRIPVTLGENTIFIRERMDYGTRVKLLASAARVSQGGDDAAANLAEYLQKLLQVNILDWDGPDFEETLPDGTRQKVPVTADNILKLDPEHPLVSKVLEEIAKHNPLRFRIPIAA